MLGYIRWVYDYDYAAGERETRLATQLDPTSAAAWDYYGLTLSIIGQDEKAIAAGRRAIELFEAAAAAGVPEAQFNLGWCFLRGQFVAVDLPRATRYFEQAADRGDVAAQCRLAEIYTHRDKDKGGGAVSAGQIGRPGCECDVLAGLSGCWAEYQKSQGRK